MKNLHEWLLDHRLEAEAYDPDELLEAFLEEMRKGLDGEPSSLAMIPAYIGIGGDLPAGKTVAVVDAGGTNLRAGLAAVDERGTVHLEAFQKRSMPGRGRTASAAEFYDAVCEALTPHADRFETIGFCFSYPAEITPDLDGILLRWTKEIDIPDLIGKRVGAGLVAALAERGAPGKRAVVLNDTVAALLAGRGPGKVFHASSFVGFILGTGTNTAYVERNRNIGKLGNPPEGAQVINVESGGFAALERGPFDVALDESSANPGANVFEKMISGVYLGPLALLAYKALAEEGFFSAPAAEEIARLETLSTIHIDNFTADNGQDVGPLAAPAFSEADREVLRTVFMAVTGRAARLAAVNIAAAVVRSGEGREAGHPVCVTIDGSTYYKTWRLAERTQEELARLLARHRLHARTVRVEDAPAAGAAIAALTAFPDA